jgi:hypothetical protein
MGPKGQHEKSAEFIGAVYPIDPSNCLHVSFNLRILAVGKTKRETATPSSGRNGLGLMAWVAFSLRNLDQCLTVTNHRKEKSMSNKHKTKGLLLASALCAALAGGGGCDASMAERPEPTVKREVSALTSETAPSIDNGGDDSPDPTIAIGWDIKEKDKKAVDVSVITLEVKNYLPVSAEISVSIHFGGLLGNEATLDLGAHTIKGNDTKTLTVPPGQVPLQTTTGVCQAVANVQAVYDNEAKTVKNASTSPLYYRHKAGYAAMLAFDENIFKEQFNGTFFDASDIVEKKGVGGIEGLAYGRINREGKGFEDLKMKSSVVNENTGEEEALLLGISVHSVPADGVEEVNR